MDVPQIRHREHLESWLKTRSREECIAIAHRAAMRVAPLWMGTLPEPYNKMQPLSEVANFRALLTSGAASSRNKPEIVAASASAYKACASSGSFALSASMAAASSVVVADAMEYFNFAARSIMDADLAAQASNKRFYFSTSVHEDLLMVAGGGLKNNGNFWGSVEAPFSLEWAQAKDRWQHSGADWGFWVRWYDAALRGEPLNWKMQEEIALLPSEVWVGDVAGLAAAIAKIEKKHARLRKPRQAKPKSDVISELLDGEKKGTKLAIAKVKAAVDKNHRELPASFDAVLGFISLEVQRLQQKNYQTDMERVEAVRQIEVLTILDAAIRAIQTIIPAQAPIELEGAEKVEKLSRLFARKFGEWPRANADDLVDNTCRFALIGAVACLAPLIGVPALYGFIGAGAIFGGKKIADAVKLAIESKALAAPPS